jgi:23S rRNA pseudouridine2605 synthase
LKQALGREVSESAVVRAITELWQQLRIIPVIAAPGSPAKWQLLRHRFQKAIAEGASTSQVTAISVLASIYLQAVIAASMEEVELFLAPLTARSKVREVLRGLLATRQVHTISLGHAPHFYVAGTLPEFTVAPTLYSSASMPANAYFLRSYEEEVHEAETPAPVRSTPPPPIPAPVKAAEPVEVRTPRPVVQRKPAPHSKPAAARPHFRGSKPHSRDRKPIASSSSSRPARHAADTHSSNGHKSNGHAANGNRSSTNGKRWVSSGPAKTTHAKNGNGSHVGNGASKNGHANGNGARSNGSSATRNGKAAAPAWGQRSSNGNAHSNGGRTNGKAAVSKGRSSGLSRNSSAPRKDARVVEARSSRTGRKPPLTAGAKAGNSKRYGFTARPKAGTKKRG